MSRKAKEKVIVPRITIEYTDIKDVSKDYKPVTARIHINDADIRDDGSLVYLIDEVWKTLGQVDSLAVKDSGYVTFYRRKEELKENHIRAKYDNDIKGRHLAGPMLFKKLGLKELNGKALDTKGD